VGFRWKYGHDSVKILRFGSEVVEIWKTYGRDLVEIWSRFGRDLDLAEKWLRNGRVLVKIWFRYGRDLVENQSRFCREIVEIWSRLGLDLSKIMILLYYTRSYTQFTPFLMERTNSTMNRLKYRKIKKFWWIKIFGTLISENTPIAYEIYSFSLLDVAPAKQQTIAQ
jgi:hypothetical protein